ncbi:calcium-translocating P-type ATPase, SERCA-type [Halocella sp. SP3-1]|uniref:calcium-translocating P-type ATPase, SERCA-type n=1 Tax=Halocella sp. SP3-1 TaxID=2382161 RepID=UPI000F7584C2|nr:calcium-translocating P-type ATPase, SERCA-type [Halocella sp. SP3-1]AZO95198.1 calcium-translocating P-type ATPase, SERCA-type [Halocella sp. SP3-1]
MLAEKEYYLLNQEELIDCFGFSLTDGLSTREIRKRQLQCGRNRLVTSSSKGILSIFIDQFRDFMIIVLMAATCLSFLMGEISDGITIFAIIIINGIMGFIQEYRAERSLVALKKLAAPEARVIRDGRLEEVAAEELVPGDLIVLEAGNRVPADCRLLEAAGLQVDESLLTGESITVAKSTGKLYAADLNITEQTNILFMGTTVTRGRAKAVVVNTGMDTEMGKIADLLNNENDNMTPLQKRLKHLGKWLVIMSLLLTFLIVIVGILKGQSIYQMFLAGVSLAVAAIPEGLPAIVTLVLALGVQKMINNNAIVRKLQSVETLGCATVICSDKTGTLTKNQMTLKKIYLNHRINNFNPDSELKDLEKVLKIGGVCNTVQLKEAENNSKLNRVKEFFIGSKIPEFLGDPTEIALVRAVYDYGYSFTSLKKDYQIKAEEGFDSKRKRMSVIVQMPEGDTELWIKGAPELILQRCTYLEVNGKKEKMTEQLKREVQRANDSMARDALRVLAIGYRKVNNRVAKNRAANYEKDLTLLGLVGLIDPPREEAYQAVLSCHKAGIKPVMITGDHKITARVIAEDLGIIPGRGRVITGEEIKGMDDKTLNNITRDVRVFARISPEDKLRIVRSYKENGEIVAMTGDGVNDAPAVKEADIGIAMGEQGTDVTKEVSSLILGDDNFATIVKAIAEGRKIYNNIRKFIRYLLACNTGELLAVFLGILMGLPIPLLPIQILWVNLVTDGLPALALGMDNDSDDVMEKPPRDPEESILAGGMVAHLVSQGSLIGISTMTAFLIAIYHLGVDLNTARTMAFSTLVFSQLFFVFSCRSEDYAFWQLSPFSNIYLLGAVLLSSIMQLGVIYSPFLSRFFKTSILNIEQWIIVLILSSWSTIVIDLIRGIFRKKR